MDNEKDKNKYPVQNTSLVSHLGADKRFVFQYKKTEKIVAALYLVTNFIEEQEPIRRDIRENGLSLLSDIMSLKDSLPAQKDELCSIIKSTLVKMISLLEISNITGLISQMNFDVLKSELLVLLDSISDSKQIAESFIIPENFFTSSEQEYEIPQTERNKGQLAAPRVEARVEKVERSKKLETSRQRLQQENQKTGGAVEAKRSSRQSIILDVIKKKKEVMIKDISDLIHDCSEKTLQRELLSMVARGILKKEGERRWSRYSLA